MIITTARKPSSKIRTFCKHLSRFTGCDYVPRGKTSLQELGAEPFLMVGEYKGNPGSFIFFNNREPLLSIRANVSLDREVNPGQEPAIQGNLPLAAALSRATGFKLGGCSERIIRVNDKIEFVDKDEPVIRLKIIGIRGEGIVRSVQERRD
ncbi:MAG: hypothetical protein O8C66_06750 [Candidatus Methanoperedens sp.]|nr:hypothetical protein [Candidatus Methanoperedens sp.]MCZ7370191.1 hypothetical protein [Candidatus Methanoperedens sp.]